MLTPRTRAGLIAAQQQQQAAEASLREAEANDLNAQDDVERYKPLAAKDEIPQQQYTQALASQKATAAAVEVVCRAIRIHGMISTAY
jgi:membrane fusion protein (multidrug efflux system)